MICLEKHIQNEIINQVANNNNLLFKKIIAEVLELSSTYDMVELVQLIPLNWPIMAISGS